MIMHVDPYMFLNFFDSQDRKFAGYCLKTHRITRKRNSKLLSAFSNQSVPELIDLSQQETVLV